MAYYNEDQLYRYFDRSIHHESNKRVDALRKEIDYLYAKEMKKIRDDLLMKKKLQLNKGLRELQIDYQDRINQIGVGYDEKLIKSRTKMANTVFNHVFEKLIDFIETKAYEAYILEKIKALDPYIGDKKTVIKISPYDHKIEAYLTKALKQNVKIVIDPKIKIGGFIVSIPSHHIEMDVTIDQKLEEQKEWFYKHSKLFIRT